MANDVRLVIYDTGIAAMSYPGGQIWRWAYQRRTRVERVAKSMAPVRTGELRRSIYGSYEPAPPQHVVMEVHAGAEHALWVHEGTGPFISAGGDLMRLRPGNGHGVVYKRVVRGQMPNPFLERALELVMRDL